ncbi:MAG TPA: protein TolQ [Gammaproteobacteria bacterium]|jgi:biopolymer transport protein TolQ|nr:protein TolQ [Gammaproteobacteria bacterium]
MNYDGSLLNYFVQAGPVVKCVMVILVAASLFSWTYILQRSVYLKDTTKTTTQFEQAFWSGEDLSKLYAETSSRQKAGLSGLEAIFRAGFKEFVRFRKQPHATTDAIIENTQRAMRVAQMREQDKLEQHLSFLAIVGSTSPYIGLFGTVWGIMQSFRALASVQQATIAMVAPGIAEALIATALGLFAAIPAVIAYNRFITYIGKLMNRYDAFQEEFTNILIRQSHQPVSQPTE